MTYNQLFIKLLTLINKRRKGFSHADFFHVGLFSFTNKLSYIMPTIDGLNINFCFDENIEHFANYDFNAIIKENNDINNLYIKPLNYFYRPKYFNIDNSLHVAYIECNKFYVPSSIIIEKDQLLPINEALKKLQN